MTMTTVEALRLARGWCPRKGAEFQRGRPEKTGNTTDDMEEASRRGDWKKWVAEDALNRARWWNGV